MNATRILIKRCGNRVVSLLLSAALLPSCSKEKEEVRRNAPYDQQIVASQTRIVLAGGMDIALNGKKVSNWLAGSTVGGGPENPPNPTPYFPATGKPGNAWFIPASFINANGKAQLQVYSPAGQIPLVTADIENSYNAPLDYYYNLQKNAASGQLTPVSRPVVKPAQPQNILIRVVNLCSDAVAGSDANETLSLAYADGQLVSAATSGIAKAHWSDYTEIPYGTYEFRMLIDGTTKQYPLVSTLNITGADDFRIADSPFYYTQRQVFQPGGVYTIVVSQKNSRDVNGAFFPANMFTVVTDLTPSVNLSYARVQLANAFADKALKVSVDDDILPAIPMGTGSDYRILTSGTHTIKWVNESGVVEKEQNIQVRGGDNYTVAYYADTNKKVGTVMLRNNMSGIINNASSEDGADGITAVFDPVTIMAMNIQCRFINLCPELPYVSFTGSNGASLSPGTAGYPAAASNLKVGTAPDAMALPYPYINLVHTAIEAYASAPGFVPGNRLAQVPALSAKYFIHLPADYYTGGLPVGEAGIYTIALVGHYNNASQPSLIVIKHNK